MAQLKRIAAPKTWQIKRKESKFIVCPNPGPHKKQECIPAGVIIRDYLKCAGNLKEAKQILNKGIVSVNGMKRKEYKFPVGTLDVMKIGDSVFRLMPTRKGLVPVKAEKGKDLKLCKVTGKTCIKGGLVQINMNNGENMVVKKGDDKYKTGDVIVFDIGKGVISNTLKFGKGAFALITGGKNKGETGTIEKIKIVRSNLPNLVDVKLDGKKVKVPQDYVFVIGEKEPLIGV